MTWDRSKHRWPCSETDAIDAMLNEMEEAIITFNQAELEQAKSYGWKRQNQSARLRNRRASLEYSDVSVNIVGVMGEMAVCKYLGQPYRFTVNTFRAADLPFNIEVRTRSGDWGALKIRPDDDDSRRVVQAVTYRPNQIRLTGWILAKAGKSYRLSDPKFAGMPIHLVPQDALNPMRQLKEEVKNNLQQHGWSDKAQSVSDEVPAMRAVLL